MKKRIMYWVIATAIIFGAGGFVVGIRVINTIEENLLAQFSEDVIEVRQGKMAGAFIALQNDAELTEQWEELCSDIIRDYVRSSGSRR